MTTLNLLNTLQQINKPFFSLADLVNIVDINRASLKVQLNRLTKKALLIRLSKGFYILPNRLDQLPVIANQLYYPSYLSFESALSQYGIINQSPYTITFATSRRSKKTILADKKVEYRQLKDKLFIGFNKVGNLFIATPEKALLDQIYLVSRGRATLSFDEVNLSSVDIKKLKELSIIFPKSTKKLLNHLIS